VVIQIIRPEITPTTIALIPIRSDDCSTPEATIPPPTESQKKIPIGFSAAIRKPVANELRYNGLSVSTIILPGHKTGRIDDHPRNSRNAVPSVQRIVRTIS
jgi:hypothetical protein